jgi:hypothetical protein
MLHWFITNEVGLATPAIPLSVMIDDVIVDPLYEIPNQTNILDQIAEVTEDESLLAAQYPVTEEEAVAPTDELLEYTDPAGNTFEAPVVEEKLSLDDILIRIPNEEKASLSPFEKMQQRIEEANARTEAEVEEDEKPWHEETVVQNDLPVLEEELEVEEVTPTVSQPVSGSDFDFDFDLETDDNVPNTDLSDFF